MAHCSSKGLNLSLLLGAVLIHSRAINKALSQVNLLTYLSGAPSSMYHLWLQVMGHLIFTQRQMAGISFRNKLECPP